MEEWVAFYQENKDWILLLLSIPIGLLINRLDTYLKNRSKEQKIKTLVAYYTQVVIQRRELNFSDPFTIWWRMAIKFLKISGLILFMLIVQTLSDPLIVYAFGKHASDLYSWSIFILACILVGIVTRIAGTEENILKDAIHFSVYRKKTIAKLTKLDYDDLDILDRVDKLISQRQ